MRIKGSRSLTAAPTVGIDQSQGAVLHLTTYSIEGIPYPPPLQDISLECKRFLLYTYHSLQHTCWLVEEYRE